ncbi:DUF421 domain-containing protein [Algoriphagus winogradskyi]|uniref:DUF421 domain-containing protein n=1 Tax=Algoriphagus winogradskyi TaxID=237017 RepID=A0ABY1NBQ3_9BACT|nr:YetF domain-containing protein [Algoriphagus winogradskyi]SMP05694.1 Protein of unknown function [Algoriphagus winogradskyi]
METLIFENWESTIRTGILTILGYLAMVFLLRISGKRTLSKMNAFDFVVTIALGSCLASIALNKNITLTDGVLAISLFIFMQFVFTFLSVHIKGFRTLVTSKPVIVFYKGEFLENEMKTQRLTSEEVFNECRLKGYANLDEVYLVVLESTGDISVIENQEKGIISTVDGLDKL